MGRATACKCVLIVKKSKSAIKSLNLWQLAFVAPTLVNTLKPHKTVPNLSLKKDQRVAVYQLQSCFPGELCSGSLPIQKLAVGLGLKSERLSLLIVLHSFKFKYHHTLSTRFYKILPHFLVTCIILN